ncbi:MAG TPA: HAMP domain-containing sensor histidine kinase [Elusimicrobiota bacterium]|nr:HAMP domain-containing sensor histidine kinase [Elusimicrobiota bacterium]
MRLTGKLILILSGLSALVLATTVTLLYVAENRHLIRQMEAEQRSALDKLAQVCADSLINQDELSRLTYLKTLWSSAEPGLLSYAALLDDGGRVLMHSDFLKGDFSRKGASLSGARKAAGDDVVLSQPVEIRGRKVAVALLAYHRSALAAAARRLQRETTGRLAGVSLAGLALSLLFAALLARALIRPIQRLRDGAREIGRGELGHRIAAASPDELGDLAREFNQMGEKLAELDELKDSFLAQITHDLRNPLATVIGRIELMQLGIQGTLTAQQTESMRIAMQSSQYLNELIEAILELTKLEAGKADFHPREVNLAVLAASVAEMLGVRAEKFGVALDVSGIPGEARVWADEQALRRLLINLVGNALNFTPAKGKVSVRCSRTSSGEDRVEVADTGIGIPADKLGTLFKKFSQVAETKGEVRDVPGTGLGLVICKRIVEGHGGRIGVESEYRRGTTFHFTLPPKPPTA